MQKRTQEPQSSHVPALERAFERRGLQPNTRSAYARCIRQFETFAKRCPSEVEPDVVEAFFDHLIDTRGSSSQTIGVYHGALSFLYRAVLKRPEMLDGVVRPRRKLSMPVVLSGTEVAAVLAAVGSWKSRTICQVMYGSGLRVSEACRLQVADVDSKRKVLRVRDGKGGHDRYALLGDALLQALREYWRKTRPDGPWLFPGDRSHSISRASAIRQSR